MDKDLTEKLCRIEHDHETGLIDPLEKYKRIVALVAMQYKRDCEAEGETKPDGMVELGLQFASTREPGAGAQ